MPESLKNVLLVMNEAGFLRPPHDPRWTPEHAPLWDATFERIQPFLPELKGKLTLQSSESLVAASLTSSCPHTAGDLFPPPKVVVPVPFEGAAPPIRSVAPPPSASAPPPPPPVAERDAQVVGVGLEQP